MADKIIREVWKVKDDLAKKFNYDFDALVAELRKIEKQSKRKTVNFEKKRTRIPSERQP